MSYKVIKNLVMTQSEKTKAAFIRSEKRYAKIRTLLDALVVTLATILIYSFL